MKQINFKRLRIKNFLSIGSDLIEINFDSGLNVITGSNKDKEDSKNGVGKSAIADATYFALFGTPLRNIRVENISNWKTKEQCQVSLEFSVIDDFVEKQYKVARSLEPSRVQLYENGVNISRTISKTNSKLKEIIGTSPDLFEQSVIMSLNQTEPFLAKKPVTKRKFIEGIFKLDIFSEMLMIIRHDINETNRNLTIESTRQEELKNNLMVYRRQQTEHTKTKDVRIEELKGRRTSNIAEIRKLSEEIKANDYDEQKRNLDQEQIQTKQKKEEISKKIRELMVDNATYQSNILNIKDKIKLLEKMGYDRCITCHRVFNDVDKEEHESSKSQHKKDIEELEEKIKKLNDDTTQLEIKRTETQKKIEDLTSRQHNIQILEQKVDAIKNRIIQCGEWNDQIKTDINDLENEKDSYKDLITDADKRLTIITSIIEDYNEKIKILDVAKFVVSEEGVKSFIVKKLLQMLNSRLNYYLTQLDANCICMFNEYFEETIVNEKGLPISYFNFSGGERKRIDLAMLFTFLDVRRLQSNISINISFYDELLDTSLDTKGIECVLEILKNRINDYNEATYIISHKNQAIKHATGEIVYLEKENEITRRLPYGS